MIKNMLFLNQAAGPLFREMAIDLAANFAERSELVTGHADTLKVEDLGDKLFVTKAPSVDRSSRLRKLISWLHYSLFISGKLLFVPSTTMVVFASNPPVLGVFVSFLGRIRGFRYVVLVYDLHPDISVTMGVLRSNGWVAKAWRFANKMVWERADAVITIGDVMAANLERQFSSAVTKLGRVSVVKPWADHEFIKPIPKKDNPFAIELRQVDAFTVMYSGNMGKSHDMESMLQAASSLRQIEKIKFVFIGEGEKWGWVRQFVSDNELSNCQVLPFQPEARLPFTLAMADVSLVSLDEGAEGLMVPSKVFYYMAAGSAVVGVCAGVNDLANCIDEAEAGLVIEPRQPEKLAAAILQLYEDDVLLTRCRVNARAKSSTYYSRHAGAAKFTSIFDDIGVRG